MPSLRRRIAFLAALLAVSLHFALAYVSDASPFLDLRAFAAGRAPLPFQTRALTAAILRAALSFDGPWAAALSHRLWPAAAVRAALPEMVVFLLALVSMLVAILSTRASLKLLTGDALFATLGAFFVPFMAYFNYILSPDAHFLLPYDLPSLSLFCVGFYLVLAGRLAWFYPVFVLACLNRETAVFLTLFFAVLVSSRTAGRLRSTRLAAHVLLQLALWMAVWLWMHRLYAHNPVEGGSYPARLLQNLHFLLRPQHWPTLLSNFGFALPFVILFRRRIPHAGLRRSLPLLGLWFALMMVAGVIIEIRIFGELISYMSLVTCLLLWDMLRRGERPREVSDAPGA